MKKLFLTLLMISGLTLSAQDENAKDWMIGVIAPIPNTTSIYSYKEEYISAERIEKSLPFGVTASYKGFVASFYATSLVYSALTNWHDGSVTTRTLQSMDRWEKSGSLGYQYTFGKSHDLLVKPVLGAHVIYHDTFDEKLTPLDLAFDFGIRYKSVALLVSAFNKTYVLNHQKLRAPVLNVKNRDTFWSIKAQYYF